VQKAMQEVDKSWHADRPPWQIVRGDGPIITTAIHAGHDVRPELADYLAISEEQRRREEDPLTGFWTTVGDSSVLVFRSRFEVDMNRSRNAAIVRDPESAWGLNVWTDIPPAEILERSLSEYDAFYEDVRQLIGSLLHDWRRLLVLDLHSYNHRRDGPEQPPAAPAENPDINIGTGTMQRDRWAPLVDSFITTLRGGTVRDGSMDVRENTRFQGGYFPEWLHSRFPENVCVLSIECKKTFMDEWTAQADIARLDELRNAFLAATSVARLKLYEFAE
jgi:N-formylglutamate amidohydrolase